MLESVLIAVTHKGFARSSLAVCLALWSGCLSSQPIGDAGVQDAGTDAMVGCPEGTCSSDGGCVLCPTPGYASWPMPNESDSAIRPASYRIEGAVVVDQVTGLTWQQEVDPQTRATAEAIAYCEDLILGERDDWRLPRRIELISLMQPGSSPTIDSDAFPGTPADYFRSSTYAAIAGDRSWSVYFGTALVIVGSAATTSAYARCVADERLALDLQFEVMETVAIDRGTDLVWRRDVQIAASQSEAEDLCSAIDSPSFRLPTLKELLTIVDDTKAEPAIDQEIFSISDSLMFWTSTEADSTTRLVDFTLGTAMNTSPSGSHAVRCVR